MGSSSILLKTSLVLVFVGLSTSFDYCNLGSDNTMCLFPDPNKLGPKCGGKVYGSGVSAADRQVILNAHNNLRRKVAKGQETQGSPGPQPPASNMRELTWDDELAVMAQTLANQCDFQHDKNRKTQSFPNGAGQNIAWGSGSTSGSKDWNAMINMWYNEVKQNDKSIVSRYAFSTKTGHYTQVVWADTYKIGCGYTNYKSGSGYDSFYVCNYGPGGNMIGAPMYKIGTAATACPKGTTAKNGLCG